MITTSKLKSSIVFSLAIFLGRGPTRSGLKAEGSRIRAEVRGSRNTSTHFKEIIELITSIIHNSLIKRLFNFHAVFSNSDKKKICCRRKVAAVKIEKLKVFAIKYYDISKTYSVQFHIYCSGELVIF